MNDRAAARKFSKLADYFWIISFLTMAGFALAIIVADSVTFVFGIDNLKPEIGLPVIIASFFAPFFAYLYLRTDQGKATLVTIIRSPMAKAIAGATSFTGKFFTLCFQGPMLKASKLDEIKEKAKACHQALTELESRAGIAEAAEKLRTAPPNYFSIYDAAEFGSVEQEQLEVAEERSHHERTIRRLRNLYFSVHDTDLRRDLIAKDREEGSLARLYSQQELFDVAAKLEAVRSAERNWWIWASLFGVIFIGLGSYLFGLVGALGGLLVGYFYGRQIEHEAARTRANAISEAEQELKEVEHAWNQIRNEPQTFSRQEAATGLPDRDLGLRAV